MIYFWQNIVKIALFNASHKNENLKTFCKYDQVYEFLWDY